MEGKVKQMDKETFVKACASCGYCSRVIAREYAGDREEFTDADFEAAYRYAEERARSHHNARSRSMGTYGCKTTRGGNPTICAR